MASVLYFMKEMAVHMLLSLPIVEGVRWLWAVRRKRKGGPFTFRHEIGLWVFGLYLISLLSQTVLSDLVVVVQQGMPAAHRINLTPFLVFRQTYIEVFHNGNTGYFFINFLGNILIFCPLGFFPPLLWEKREKFYWSVLLGGGLSAAIEVTQLLLPRATDIDDVWLNACGAMLGWLGWRLAKGIWPRFSQSFRLPLRESPEKEGLRG